MNGPVCKPLGMEGLTLLSGLARRLHSAVARSEARSRRLRCSARNSFADALQDNFLDGTSSTYLEELEERYLSDPSSVDKTWASFFHNLGASCCVAFAAE